MLHVHMDLALPFDIIILNFKCMKKEKEGASLS